MTPYAANACDLAAELSPTSVCEYLVSQGYRPIGYHAWPGQPLASVAMFNRDGAQPQMAIEVPLNPALRDYGRRTHEALDALDGAFLGLLHAIDPERFPRERILALAGVTP